MSVGTLTIYSASAGSGKTHQLTGIYLEKLFRSRLSYRRILAVTFTHKATAEMKDRILNELDKLAGGLPSAYLIDISTSTGKSEALIRKEAGEILSSILHDYSRFSVSTIDSFYQKIVRAFARDIGLHSGFDIVTDHNIILSKAVDNMISSAAKDEALKDWLLMFARANIEEGKSWDLRRSITALAGELFNEKFRLLPAGEKEKLRDKDFLVSYIDEMKALMSDFTAYIKQAALNANAFFDTYGLTDDMFFQKGKGVPSFIRTAAAGEFKIPNSYVRSAVADPPRWSSGKPAPALEQALEAGLADIVRDMVAYYDRNTAAYKTAKAILSYIYILGILSDILVQVRHITRDENLFLLSDAGELICLITDKDQAPFIYEKVGNAFENFMIDEFQDTSVIQWKNFRQLIENSMAQGFDNLVVGDIKQSIYRWRNSDWHTLRDLKRSVDGSRFISKPLETNYRSCSNIIRFNNSLFSIIPGQLEPELSEAGQHSEFGELFSEVVQNDPGRKPDGYVRLEFIENTEESKWQEEVLNRLPELIESIQDKGYSASDIGILVRDNREGAVVLKKILDYTNSCPEEKKSRYNYNIVSGESLLLSNSPVVNFIIAVLMVLDNPKDMIARALMLRNFLLATGSADAEKVALPAEELIVFFQIYFPEGYIELLDSLRNQPLWNITEKVTGFFGLGNFSFNVPYLNAFQDIVLGQASARNPGIASFLEWWNTEGVKKSIAVPDSQDSIRVLTIHKSKGLEFEIVILPFLSWNLDHKPFLSNILWAVPDSPPFNKLGIVPLRYSSELADTIFADQYFDERLSAYLDNINLLYVAFTRAVSAIFGFAPAKPGADSRIASVISKAISFTGNHPDESPAFLHTFFDQDSGILEFGNLPDVHRETAPGMGLFVGEYPVNDLNASLKLKFNWEDYLDAGKSDAREKITYGRMMHDLFSRILSADDVPEAVRKMVRAGEITKQEEDSMIRNIHSLIGQPHVNVWFAEGNVVLNEATLLMPDSGTRRPDRVIIRDGKTYIVDFKFGEESDSHLRQVREYRKILTEMAYDVAGAYIWYVDANRIVTV